MKPHVFCVVFLLACAATAHAASQKNIPAPVGSGSFGASITPLPNGNFVVVDISFNLSPSQTNVGAVYLYRPDGTLVSRLTGSTSNDQVGLFGVVVLANGNFVVRSGVWDNGANANAGAVTWGSAVTGFRGGPLATVSAANSLVGSSSGDGVGIAGVTVLSNGHYVVRCPNWDNGVISDAGAVTWGNGNTGTIGVISPANSLVGSTANDQVGSLSLYTLTNGNYVVSSPGWDNGAIPDAGAATWGNGSGGTAGPVSAANSLVGSTAADQVGNGSVRALPTGHYVVLSPLWDNGGIINAGAATWGNGNIGITGTVTAANSLVGSTSNDSIGIFSGAVALTNGHYVIVSQEWNHGAANDAGAVTWCNGSGGTVGPVSASNSLVGSTSGDRLGSSDVVALTNGHYVVGSSGWDNGPIVDAGAATWGNGNGGTVGPVTPANSLVGTQAGDGVCGRAYPLTNGHYVVSSDQWNNGTADVAGAVTWCHGNGGTVGPVSAANSLVGTQSFDRVGFNAVLPLTNGNYVVFSAEWDNGPIVNAGAATWGNGNGGTFGPVSPANSLVGSSSEDRVGGAYPPALTNGHYVVISQQWDNGSVSDAGAVTWGNGNGGTVGPVSAANSLVGSEVQDFVGDPGVVALTNGHYVVRSMGCDVGSVSDAGAVTWGRGTGGTVGPVSALNSLVGSTPGDFVGNLHVTALENGNYRVSSNVWDNRDLADAGAVTLGDGAAGTTGPISHSNSVVGEMAFATVNVASFLPASAQLVVGSPNEGRIVLFGNRLDSLAVAGAAVPGVTDALFAQPGPIAVSGAGTVLFDAGLAGPGAAKGKNRAVFADAIPGSALGLVLQRGDSIAALGGGLPANATVSALLSPLHQNLGRGVFQIVASGSGLTSINNRLIVRDNGSALNQVLRTGQLHPLYAQPYRAFLEVLQSHNADLLVVSHRLTAPGSADTGLVTLRHSGSPTSAGAAPSQEGQPSGLPAIGTLGQLGPRAAAGLGGQISFSSIASMTGKPALLRVNETGTALADDARAGALAPGIPGATLASFPAFTQLDGQTLYKALLGGVSKATNEAIYCAADGTPRLRKGDPLPGASITGIVRFWPGGPNQVLALVNLSDKSQALILRQSDSQILILARTRQTMPGTGAALLQTINAVDVNVLNGRYVILGTLANATPASNQALWTGCTVLGADTPSAEQTRRLPVLRLRKGETFSTAVSPLSTVKSMLLQPANDIGGAGGRGLHHAIGAEGHVAVVLTTAANTRHWVLLPP